MHTTHTHTTELMNIFYSNFTLWFRIGNIILLQKNLNRSRKFYRTIDFSVNDMREATHYSDRVRNLAVFDWRVELCTNGCNFSDRRVMVSVMGNVQKFFPVFCRLFRRDQYTQEGSHVT